MANYSTNEFRSGIKVMLDGDPCSILENEFVKPGKGQAFNRVRLRNLKTGRGWERTFKSGDSLESADVVERSMENLYNDGEFWYFMEPDTFEQYQADLNAVGETNISQLIKKLCEVNHLFDYQMSFTDVKQHIIVLQCCSETMNVIAGLLNGN